MARPDESVPPPTEVDELRRRLYRAGATDDDVQRYTDANGSPADPGTGTRTGTGTGTGTSEAPAAPGPRPRRRLPVVALVTAAVLVAGVAVGPTLIGLSSEQEQPDEDAGATTAAGRVSAPVSIAVFAGGADALAQQFNGVGPVDVTLDVSSAPSGGRALISLSPSSRAPLAWRAIRVESREDGTEAEQVVARSAPATHQNVEVPSVFPYEGAPPARVRVVAAADSPWTLTVAFTDRSPQGG